MHTYNVNNIYIHIMLIICNVNNNHIKFLYINLLLIYVNNITIII